LDIYLPLEWGGDGRKSVVYSAMSWNPKTFASMVQAQPLLIFDRPVHLIESYLDYDPVVLLKPFRPHLTVDTLAVRLREAKVKVLEKGPLHNFLGKRGE